MDIRHKRKRIRYKLKRLSNRPRLSVHKSNKYVYAQLIDQKTGNVLASYDTKRLVKDYPDFKDKKGMEKVIKMAEVLAERIKKLNISAIVFDRSGYKYHGKIKAIAETLRSAGLNF